jgi:hypothetical protein
MTLNVAQYLAPLNSAQVLTGYTQGVKQGVGIIIATDGTITLDTSGAATLGFLTSSSTPAPVYNWSTVAGASGSVLANDGLGNVAWSTDYIQSYPLGSPYPHTGAAAIPAGSTGQRPGGAQPGFLRYNTGLGYLEFNNGTTWLPVSQASGGVFSFVTTLTPTPNAAGDLWLDTNTNQAKMWSGSAWVPTSPLATAGVPGRVKIGTNVQIAGDGTISILPTTGVSGAVSNIGVTTVTDNVSSLSIDSALSANQGRLLQNQIAALLISNNLTFAGLISGAGVVTYVTPAGLLQGFALGSPLPSASVSNDEYFVIVDSAGGFVPPGGVFTTVTQGDWFLSSALTWQFLNVGYDPPYATTLVPGIIEIATDAETQAGTDTTRAVTPSSLSSRTATETRSGIAEIANQAEANAGVDDTRIITPLKLFGVLSSGAIDSNDILLNPVINGNLNVQTALNDAVYDIDSPANTILVVESAVGQVDIDVVQATETQRGAAEIATQIETNAGTNDLTILTPLKLAQFIASGQITAPEIPLDPSINGSVNVQQALTDAIYDIDSPGATLSITETATGQIDIDIVQATEGQLGGAQIATDVETQALALDNVIVTPLKLGNLFSSGILNATDILLSPAINGNTNVQAALNDAVYNIASSGGSVTIAETATGQINLAVTQATEGQLGGAEIATQAETDAGTSDTAVITPLKLANRTATETRTGIAELATQVETEAGTDDTRIVTPLKLRTAAVYKSDFNAKGDILSASSDNTPVILPVGTNGQSLVVDSTTASGLKWSTPAVVTFQFQTLDDVSASFNGATVSFPLSIGAVPYTPNPSTNIMVFVGGVVQIPGASNAYTVTGSNITFTSAPPTGASFYATTVV